MTYQVDGYRDNAVQAIRRADEGKTPAEEANHIAAAQVYATLAVSAALSDLAFIFQTSDLMRGQR